MSDRNTAILIIVAVIVGLSVYAHSAARQNRIDACIAAAEKRYSDKWDSECVGTGREPDCRLPGNLADYVKAERDSDKALCVARY